MTNTRTRARRRVGASPRSKRSSCSASPEWPAPPPSPTSTTGPCTTAPAGTGDWFGWANAMVSELIPLAAGLELRRRVRLYGSAGIYPVALIIGAVALSLTGQFAEAKPRSPAGSSPPSPPWASSPWSSWSCPAPTNNRPPRRILDPVRSSTGPGPTTTFARRRRLFRPSSSTRCRNICWPRPASRPPTTSKPPGSPSRLMNSPPGSPSRTHRCRTCCPTSQHGTPAAHQRAHLGATA